MLTSLFADLSPALAMSVSASLTDAIASVYGFLSEFAKREDFFDKSEFVFGQTLDRGVLGALRDQWIAGDFSKFPDLKLLSASDLQGANAAFAGSTGEIYLSTEFLSQYVGSPQVLAAVLLEEVVLQRSVQVPTAVLYEPVVLSRMHDLPTAVFSTPDVVAKSAIEPTAVLLKPVVMF